MTWGGVVKIRIVNPAPTPEQIVNWQAVARPQVLRYQTAIAWTSGLLVMTIWSGLVCYALTR